MNRGLGEEWYRRFRALWNSDYAKSITQDALNEELQQMLSVSLTLFPTIQRQSEQVKNGIEPTEFKQRQSIRERPTSPMIIEVQYEMIAELKPKIVATNNIDVQWSWTRAAERHENLGKPAETLHVNAWTSRT